MTDIHVLDSGRLCPESIINKDLGAGTNAATRTEMVFISTSPLSELVWSPHKGLSLKYAGSSIAEKKGSLIWNTESFNIIISSPQHTYLGESSNHKDLAAGNMNNMQLVSLVSSSRSTVDVQAASLTMYTSKDLSSNEDIKLMNMTMKEVLDDKNEDNKFEKKELGICPTGIGNGFHNNDPEKEAVVTAHAKTFVPGKNGNPQSTDSISCSLNELRPDPDQIECTSNAATSSDHLKRFVGRKNPHTSRLAKVSAYEDIMLARNGNNGKSESSSSSSEWKQTDLALPDMEQKVNSINKDLTSFHLLGKQCSGEVQSIISGSDRKVTMTVALEAPDACNCETWAANNKDESTPVGPQTLANVKYRNLEKGKQKVVYDEEGSGSTSKARGDSHESVESSSCTRPISPRKRAWKFDSEVSMTSKRFKKESNHSSCSGHLLKNDSSFMNWIFAISNGFPKSDRTTPFLEHVPQFLNNRKETFGSLAMSEDENPDASCRTAGFNSLFQALYRPRILGQNNINDHDHQKEADAPKELVNTKLVRDSHHMGNGDLEFNLSRTGPVTTEWIANGSKALHITSEPSAVGNLPITCDVESGKSPNQVSVSCDRFDQDSYKVGEFASPTVKVSSTSSTPYENMQHNIRQLWPLSSVGSPSPSAKKRSGSPEAKETAILRFVPNSSSNLVIDSRSGFLGNKWITRFMPKVSSPMLNPMPCDMDMGLASKRSKTEANMVTAPYTDYLASSKEHNMSEDHYLRYLECQRVVTRGEDQQYSFCAATPCSSKMQGDQKLKSKLNPILPSQKFKKSEPMASLFAKRLDALRHILPSETSNVPCATCFFCGNIGHSSRECAELVKSDLQDLPKFANSYDCTDISSSLCIHCIEVDRWAVICPHASSRKQNVDHSFIARHKNCDKIEDKQGNRRSDNRDRSIIFWDGDEQEHQQLITGFTIPERGDLGSKSELMVHASNCTAKAATPSANAVYSYPVREDIVQRIAKVKQSTSCSGSRELKQSPIIPFCRVRAAEATDEIFEIIRMLRLSRTDVIRWLRSPIAHFSLEGFFLRLRLHKLEEGLGGTGYHVARITGASCENGLSVSIGRFTHSVDCHFVSNHDFVEDELKVWWSAALKGDGMLPSREELHKKLQERMKFGL